MLRKKGKLLCKARRRCKGLDDKHHASEGGMYSAGAFDYGALASIISLPSN